MENFVSPVALMFVPLVVALVEVSKMYLGSKYSPLMSLVLGVGASFLVAANQSIPVIIISGLVVGLTASGLYSGGKTVMGVVTNTPEDDSSER